VDIVEIIVPVHNRKEKTLRCLKSLSRIDKTGMKVNILVVDDGSTDGTADAIREFYPDVEIVKGSGTLFYTGGINLGLETVLQRESNFILTINDDEVFDAKFLQKMVSTATANPGSVVGAVLLRTDIPHRLTQTAPRWETLSGGWRHWYNQTVWTIPQNPWKVDLIVGNCVLFPTAAIRAAGLMDVKRHPHYGDSEYTPRLRKLGWKLLIEPGARVFCQPNEPGTRVRNFSFAVMWNVLYVDLKNALNLRRKFYEYWDSAPTKLHALAAYPIFFIRILAGKNMNGTYAATLKEAPLSETYKNNIV
jgi:GT2 family glycosyltransferase